MTTALEEDKMESTTTLQVRGDQLVRKVVKWKKTSMVE
jgi:hypothetical protein